MRIELQRPRSVRALQHDKHFLQIYGSVWEKLEQGLAPVQELV
jgi:hypothetical protein